MRRGSLQISVLVTGFLLVGRDSVYAQQPALQSNAPCPVSGPQKERPSGPETTIAEVTFIGSLRMPTPDQQQIADSIKQLTHGTSLNGVLDEALERTRRGWQNDGYFKVEVSGETKILTSNPVSRRIALNVNVDEGSQYKLSGITFKNNKGIRSVDTLRGFFPIEDGAIFSREKIAIGLENLRKAYSVLGYINFTSVPDTKFDDENRSISLVIDFDEGRQFRVGRVDVRGLEGSAREQVLKTLPQPGQIYSSNIWEESLLKSASQFPNCGCGSYTAEKAQQSRTMDEQKGLVDLMFDFQPCPNN